MPYEQRKPELLKDTDLIPTGKYAKERLRMIDVPAKYLLYIYENSICNDRVREYIKNNLEVIKSQAKKDSND